mgnify:CR=1 FL=1
MWISPNQIKIITVNDDCIEYAKEIENKYRTKGLRVKTDYRSETIGKKVREARHERFNYIVTIGEKEVKAKTIAVKTRAGEMKFGVKVENFLKELRKEVEKKEIK